MPATRIDKGFFNAVVAVWSQIEKPQDFAPVVLS
jgi:hypothetical protein